MGSPHAISPFDLQQFQVLLAASHAQKRVRRVRLHVTHVSKEKEVFPAVLSRPNASKQGLAGRLC